MSFRLSTGMRNRMLDGGSTGGVKGAFNPGYIDIYTGTQPASPDTGATGVLLGTITVNGDGSTGIHFDASASGTIAKAVAEAWKFVGLAAGVAGYFRLYASGDTPANLSTTAPRIDGAVGTSGAELNLSNLNVVVSQVNTCDGFSFTMPAS